MGHTDARCHAADIEHYPGSDVMRHRRTGGYRGTQLRLGPSEPAQLSPSAHRRQFDYPDRPAWDRRARLHYPAVSRRRLARIYSIATAPDYLGRGVAAGLLDVAEACALAHNCMAMRLEIRKDNAPSQRLFLRYGYALFGSHDGYYEDGMDALRFEKSLTAHLRICASAPGAAAHGLLLAGPRFYLRRLLLDDGHESL